MATISSSLCSMGRSNSDALPAQVSSHSKLTLTAFPKINGKRTEFLSSLKSLVRKERLRYNSTVVLEGSVKLHGIHADIVYPLEAEDLYSVGGSDGLKSTYVHEGLKIVFQTRNREVLPSESVYDYPKKLALHLDILAKFKFRILARFVDVHPEEPLDHAYSLIVAGEWIGQDVQKHVGISQLTTRFVVTAISINGKWQNEAVFADIEEPSAHIYSVLGRVPAYHVDFWLGDLTEDNPAFDNMQKIADDVEKNCPFAAAFGVKNSQGEGVVWKIGTRLGRTQPTKWFKTKGPISMGRASQPDTDINTMWNIDRHLSADLDFDLQRESEHLSNIKPSKSYGHARKGHCLRVPAYLSQGPSLSGMDLLAGHYVTDRRIEQGFEYLVEMRISPFDNATVHNAQELFLQWMIDDIFDEECAEIGGLCLKNKSQYNPKKLVGFKYDVRLKEAIQRLAHRRYLDELSAKGQRYRQMFAKSFRENLEAAESETGNGEIGNTEAIFEGSLLESSTSTVSAADQCQLDSNMNEDESEPGYAHRVADTTTNNANQPSKEPDLKNDLEQAREQWVSVVRRSDLAQTKEREQLLSCPVHIKTNIADVSQ